MAQAAWAHAITCRCSSGSPWVPRSRGAGRAGHGLVRDASKRHRTFNDEGDVISTNYNFYGTKADSFNDIMAIKVLEYGANVFIYGVDIDEAYLKLIVTLTRTFQEGH
jgi:hypothetical protein